MSTIDERGRTASAALRHGMTSQFDVETGLAELLRDEPVVAASSPQDPRRGWMLAAAATVVVALGAVGVLALRDDTSSVSDTPAPTAVPDTTSPPASTAVTDEVTETTLVPDTAVPTTVVPVERTVRVADVVQIVEPRRTVLATAGLGSGPGELGVEECQECDPARPWAPVAIPFGPRGKVLVADTANRRWVLFEPDNPDAAVSPWSATEVPWPDGVGVSSQPVVDQGGTVYAVMSGPLGEGRTNTSELWTLDWRDLGEPTGRYPVSTGDASVSLGLTSVAVGRQVIEGLVPSMSEVPDVVMMLGDADPAAASPAQVIATWQGSSTTFDYDDGDFFSFYGPNPALPDLSVLTFETGPAGETVDRLFLDGRVARVQLPPSGAVSGAAVATENGFVRLELSADGSTWEIARYELPVTSLTRREPASDRASAVFAELVAPDAESYLASAGAALGAAYRDDCGGDPLVEDPSASWQQVSGGVSDAIATFELRSGCDDSSVGYRWVAEMRAGGDGWRAVTVSEQTICARGVTTDGDTELCI